MSDAVDILIVAVQPIVIVLATGAALWLRKKLKISNEQGDALARAGQAAAGAVVALAKGNEKAEPIANVINSGMAGAAQVWENTKAPTPEMLAAEKVITDAAAKIGQ